MTEIDANPGLLEGGQGPFNWKPISYSIPISGESFVNLIALDMARYYGKKRKRAAYRLNKRDNSAMGKYLDESNKEMFAKAFKNIYSSVIGDRKT